MQRVYPNKSSTTSTYFPFKTYTSLRDYLQGVKNHHQELHVFGTGSLSKEVKRHYSIHSTNISEMEQKIFRSFRTAQTAIYLQALARKIILERNDTNKKFLLNRLDQIVDNYYNFVDIGLERIEVHFQDNVKNQIAAIINGLLADPLTIEYYRMKNTLTKKEISSLLCGHPSLNNIFFYEIEYMNFGRMNFIHWLRAKGFHIEFRIPFHPLYPNVHQFWENVYKVITNQSPSSRTDFARWREKDSPNRFACFYENKTVPSADRNDVKIIEFETMQDFSQYVKKSHDSYYAVDSEDIQPIIQDTYMPIYENSVGKFIYYIQFCKIEHGQLFLSFETLIELITTSWVYTKNASGIDALSLLIDLQEYMSGTESIDDINERLKRLAELDMVNKSFDRVNSEESGRNRMKRYMLNPFRTFPYLNADRYQVTIHQLIELVAFTEKLCKNLLLEENDTCNVNEYFTRWKTVLNQRIKDTEQKELLNKVFHEKYPQHWEFSIRELLQLLYLNISRVTEVKKVIRSLPLIQEEMIERKESTLHLTNLTQMNFPEKHKSVLSNIFTYTDVKRCIQQVSRKNSLLHALLVDFTVADSFEKLGIYQIYNILENYTGPIIFSWIKNLHDDAIRNVFLDIIADLYADGEIKSIRLLAEHHPLDAEQQVEPKTHTIDVKNIQGKIPDLFWLDHDFCSKKFFLTAIIQRQPIYEENFHQEIVFAKIGKLFSYSKMERENFRKYIYPLFPHWTDTKKDNLIDTEFKLQFTRYKTYENISYPREMKGLQILRSVYRENRRTKARNQYRKDSPFQEKEILKQFQNNVGTFSVKAEPGNHCKMCPFLSSCTEGMYAIDHISQ
ncbi:hypothetical protein GCM10010978_17150 [Compostibacillus humi]|uniref:Uncharacterized protein n=1 Tax=Compostibacillus humi TaxID=1245525 RepID=A0A8J2TRR3_9BACI|nr:hypothetical protein [Compostibacillus humi]GFZ75998.1 hypothetical protein GCM10010978_17150 [Compostibacillus humi]